MAPQKPVIASAYSDVQNDQHYDDGISDGGSGGYRDENDDEEYNMNVGSGDGSGYGKHTIMAPLSIVSNRIVRLCCRFDDARRLRRRVAQLQRIGDDGTGSGTRLGARQRPAAGHDGVRRAGPAVERRHRQRRSATLSAAQRPSQSLPPPFPSDPHHRCQRVGVKTRTPLPPHPNPKIYAATPQQQPQQNENGRKPPVIPTRKTSYIVTTTKKRDRDRA